MKVKVNRRLDSGTYHVNFEVSDFTPEELSKMSSFGVPAIQLEYFAGGGRVTTGVQINQINKRYDATFRTEEEAKKYEQMVLQQMKAALEFLRVHKDEFSGSQEVEL